jgi:ankyrin repeat protein
MTALMQSSGEGHLETTRFLVESGANVEAKDKEYYTP